jgi:hypothetical protein
MAIGNCGDFKQKSGYHFVHELLVFINYSPKENWARKVVDDD